MAGIAWVARLAEAQLFNVDTTKPIDFDAVTAWLRAVMAGGA